MGAARIAAAFASVGAAVVHAAAVPDHFTEWLPSGLGFAAVGAFQVVWGAAVLVRGGRVMMGLGLLANAASLAVWAVSRSVGMPVGPNAGVPEKIGRAGLTVVALEVVVCLVALWHLRSRNARGFASSFRAIVMVGAASALVAGTVLPATEAALSHDHGHGHGHGPAEEDGPHPHGPEEDDGPGHSTEPEPEPRPEESPGTEGSTGPSAPGDGSPTAPEPGDHHDSGEEHAH